MSNDTVFDVRDYGAQSDNQDAIINQVAFQNAIDACSKRGGGTILVPPGTWLTGPFELNSFQTLHVEAGARIVASEQLSHYKRDPEQFHPEFVNVGLITARHCQDTKITGRGIIDGNSPKWLDINRIKPPAGGADHDVNLTRQGLSFNDTTHDKTNTATLYAPEFSLRPGNLVSWNKCINASITDITLCNSNSWTMVFVDCDAVLVHGLKIHSRDMNMRVPNDDGIDFVNSRGVRVSDCDIETGDDCLAVVGCENMVVTNCTLYARSAAVRIGFVAGTVKNIIVTNCTITSPRCFGLFVRSDITIENVLVSNCILNSPLTVGHWWGSTLFFYMGLT
jgi:polygalacturonase